MQYLPNVARSRDLSHTFDGRHLKDTDISSGEKTEVKNKKHWEKLNRSELSAGRNNTLLKLAVKEQRRGAKSKCGNQGKYYIFFMSFY